VSRQPQGRLRQLLFRLSHSPAWQLTGSRCRFLEQALSQMLTSCHLLLEEIDGEPLIFLPHLRKAEEAIAAKFKQLAEAETIYPAIDLEKAVAWCEQRTDKTLASSQREGSDWTVLRRRPNEGVPSASPS
jgi:hypothetical protein